MRIIGPGLVIAATGVGAGDLVAAVLVVAGGYRSFEKLIGLFIGLMFVSLIGTALMVQPPGKSLVEIVSAAALPAGSGRYILGVIGGVGGSVTLLSYGYWIRERGWEGPGRLRTVRIDLAIAYILTGIFGLAVMVLASSVLFGGPEIEGSRGVLTMAGMLDTVVGPIGHWTFLVGFWGAVATSMLGVWQGVPYLFCDFVGLMRRLPEDEQRAALSTRSPWYRAYLLWLAFPPMLLLPFGKPVGLIVLYSVMSALFMPFLAATLLYMNSRRQLVGDRLRNGWGAKLALLLCLGLFAYLGVRKLAELFF